MLCFVVFAFGFGIHFAFDLWFMWLSECFDCGLCLMICLFVRDCLAGWWVCDELFGC